MSEYVFDTFGDLVFGDDGTTEDPYGLIESPGSSDVAMSGTLLDGAGTDGASITPQWGDTRAWSTVFEMRADDAASFDAKRDALLAATSISRNRFDETAYVFNTRDRALTSFCRVTRRSIPRDEGTEVWFDAQGSISFAAMDPLLYGEADTISFTGDSDSEVIDTDAWAPSYRWTWTVPGPVTNPQLSSDAGTGLTVRYVGEIADGDNLVVVMYPRGIKAMTTKIVADADLADAEVFSVGTWCYGSLDGGAGSNCPPQWFPIADGVTISYAASSGTAGSSLVWLPGYD